MSIVNDKQEKNLFYYGNLTLKNRSEEEELTRFWSVFLYFTP